MEGATTSPVTTLKLAMKHGVPCRMYAYSGRSTKPGFMGNVGAARSRLAQDSTEATQEVWGFRWKIEQGHRGGKQVTGLERCQCRQARIQRNHIGCALLVWVRLKARAAETGRTVYQLKHGLLDDYLIQQLRNPSLKMVLA